jgi:hypothetical protein
MGFVLILIWDTDNHTCDEQAAMFLKRYRYVCIYQSSIFHKLLIMNIIQLVKIPYFRKQGSICILVKWCHYLFSQLSSIRT